MNMGILIVLVFQNNTMWDGLLVTKQDIYFYKDVFFSPQVNKYSSLNDIKDEDKREAITKKFEMVEMEQLDRMKCGFCAFQSRPIHCVCFCRDHTLKLEMNGHALSAFVSVMHNSNKYKNRVISRFKKLIKHRPTIGKLPSVIIFKVDLTFCKNYIDLRWNHCVEKLLIERQELGECMSWLSTLGGAFSALGDEFGNYATVAGRISIKQLRIALRLGDPCLVARCKLYFALSLIQRGCLKRAKYIIQEQYQSAKSLPVLDTCLIRMCLGIWAKLKYSYHLRKVKKNKIYLINGQRAMTS